MKVKNFKKISILALALLTLSTTSLGEEKSKIALEVGNTVIIKDGVYEEVVGSERIFKTYQGGILIKEEKKDSSNNTTSLRSYDELGLLHGKFFDKEGNISTYYNHGVLSGDYLSSNTRGKIVDGVFDGKFKFNNGEKTSTLKYSNGLPVGDSGISIEKPKEQEVQDILSTREVQNGRYYSIIEDENGNGYKAFTVNEMVDGSVVSSKTYDKEGYKVLEVISNKDKSLVKSNYSKGTLISSFSKDSNSKITRKINSFSGKDEDIKEYFITNFDQGIAHGEADVIRFNKTSHSTELIKGFFNLGVYTGYSPLTKTYLNDSVPSPSKVWIPKNKNITPIKSVSYDDIKDNIGKYNGYAFNTLNDPNNGSIAATHLLKYNHGTLTRKYVYLGDTIVRIIDYKLTGGYSVTNFYSNTFYINTLEEYNSGSLKDGPFTSYSIDGKTKISGEFKDGKPVGRVETKIYSNHKFNLVSYYEVEGDSYSGVSYYPSGKFMNRFQGKILDNGTLMPTGQSDLYNEDGSLKSVTLFGDSLDPKKIITIKTYDSNGKVASVEKKDLN